MCITAKILLTFLFEGSSMETQVARLTLVTHSYCTEFQILFLNDARVLKTEIGASGYYWLIRFQSQSGSVSTRYGVYLILIFQRRRRRRRKEQKNECPTPKTCLHIPRDDDNT